MPVTEYYWDELSDNVLMEADENGDPTAVYTNEPGQFGELVSQERGGVESFYHFDGQGSTRELTDSSGVVTDEYTYTAFGKTVTSSGMTVNPFQFGGTFAYYTNGAGDIYVRRRQLVTSSGRWSTIDPLGFMDGTNRYVFALNNPIIFVDPAGTLLFVQNGGFTDGSMPVGPICGQYQWLNRFNLYWFGRRNDPFAKYSISNIGGFVIQTGVWIQHVTHRYTCFSCDFPPVMTTGTVDFWEWVNLEARPPHIPAPIRAPLGPFEVRFYAEDIHTITYAATGVPVQCACQSVLEVSSYLGITFGTRLVDDFFGILAWPHADLPLWWDRRFPPSGVGIVHPATQHNWGFTVTCSLGACARTSAFGFF